METVRRGRKKKFFTVISGDPVIDGFHKSTMKSRFLNDHFYLIILPRRLHGGYFMNRIGIDSILTARDYDYERKRERGEKKKRHARDFELEKKERKKNPASQRDF